MHKKIILMACILVAAVGVAIWCLAGMEWESFQKANTAADYSTAATERAWLGGSIGKNEILLVDQISKDDHGNVAVTFQIFSLAEGAKAEGFWELSATQAQNQPALTQVGTASADFVGDDLAGIRNLKVNHTK